MVSKSKVSTILLVIGIGLVVVIFTSEQNIRQWFEAHNELAFGDIPLQTAAERSFHLPEGMQGYVVFYSSVVECSGCIREINSLKKMAEIYPEIGFYAVVKRGEHFRQFIEAMQYMEIPGDYLLDVQGKIQNRLGLGDHPHLLFLDSDMKLVALLPVDVTHDDLVRQMHRYIAVM